MNRKYRLLAQLTAHEIKSALRAIDVPQPRGLGALRVAELEGWIVDNLSLREVEALVRRANLDRRRGK